MSDDLWLIVELFGLLVAAALAAYSIAKCDLRPMVAATTAGLFPWLLAGFMSESGEPYKRLGLLTLQFRVVDAATEKTVHGATIYVVANDESGGAARYPLPFSTVLPEPGAAPEVLIVSLFTERRISGSLYEQFRNPSASNQLVDQDLEIIAPGYRRWRGTLNQLLPDGWPTSADPARIVIALRPVS